MRYVSLFIYSLFAFFLVTSVSCEKEKIYPDVSVQPGLENSYNYGDTILVRFTASKVNGKVRVSVLDGAKVINLPSKQVYQYRNDYEYEIYFNDKYLPSGAYDIRVTAFNEDNGTSKFVKVNLVELQRRRRGVVALAANNSSSTLLRQDSSLAIISKPLNGDYRFLSYSGRFFQVVVAPVENVQLTAFSFKDLSEDYSVPLLTSNGIRLYEGLIDIEGYPNALTSDGRLKSFSGTGTQSQANLVSNNFIGKKISFSNSKIAIAGHDEATGFWTLFILNAANRNVTHSYQFAGEVIDVEWYNNNNCIVAYRKQNRTIIAGYNIDERTFTEQVEITGVSGTDLERIGANTMLLSTNTGIYSFNPLSTANPSQVYNQGALKMAYDDLSNEVYYASGNQVYKAVLGLPWQYVMAHTDSIINVEIAYNK